MEQIKGYKRFNRFNKRLLKNTFNIKIENNRHFKKDEPIIFVVNHNNWIDPFLVLSFLDNVNMTHLLAEEADLLGTKFAKRVSHKTGDMILGVQRGNTKSRTASLKKMIEVLRNDKSSIIVFPEGRFSKEECKMFPFYQGAFAVSIKYDIPVVPIMIKGNFELYLRKPITMKIGEPLYSNGMNKVEFTEYVYNYMNDNMPLYPGEGPKLKVGRFITDIVVKSRADLEFKEKTIRHKDYADLYDR